MATTTQYLNLKLLGTSQADKATYFEDWRQDINGEGPGSNMQIIDAAYHQLEENIRGKTDKISGAIPGNFVTVDGNGNIVDSGRKPSDYLIHYDIIGKADKVTGATSGNFASLDSNGNITDSGHKPGDYLTQHQDISGKADKVTSATNGNFATLDSNGNITDSGHKHSDYAIYRYIADVGGNSSEVTMSYEAAYSWYGDPVFSDNARVIGYYAEQWKYYENIDVTISSQNIIVGVDIIGGAPAGILEIYISKTT